MITKIIKDMEATEQVLYTCPTSKRSTISRFSITNTSDRRNNF